jgi:hypothetical protein
VGVRVALVGALLTAGCTIISTRHLDWEQVQVAGGVRVLDPIVAADGRVELPLDFDESGLTAVTVRPTAMDSFAVALEPEVRVVGSSIQFTIVVGDPKGRPVSVHAPPIVLRELPQGDYEVAYRNPSGDLTPVRAIRITEPAPPGRRAADLSSSRFGTALLGRGALPPWIVADVGSSGFWDPTAEDVLHAESRIVDAVDLAAHRPEAAPADLARPGFLAEMGQVARFLPDYRAQVVGLVVEGHRRLYFNVFISDGPRESVPTEWVEVDDGGISFWRIQYDLDDDRCLGFECNGYA